MQLRNRHNSAVPLLALAVTGASARDARAESGTLHMGHLTPYARRTTQGRTVLDLDAMQAAGIDMGTMGLQLAGGRAGASLPAGVQAAIDGAIHPLYDTMNKALGDVNGRINDLSGKIDQIMQAVQNPSASSLVAARRADARARNTPVLLDVEPDQRRLQHMMVNGAIAPTGGAAGSTNIQGNSQIILKPKRMIVGGADLTYTAGGFGLLGVVVTQIFVGNKLQTTNVPGGNGGIPIEYFSKGAFDANFEYDTIGPAITVSLGVAWPAAFAAGTTAFNAVITGDSAFS